MKKQISVSMPAAIATGIITGILISVLAAAGIAWAIHEEMIGLDHSRLFTALTHLLSSFAAGIVGASMTKSKKVICIICASVGYIVVMLGLTALIFGGRYEGVLIALLMCLISTGAAILLNSRHKNKGLRKHKIPAYR